MIAVDTNTLVSAHRGESRFFAAANRCIKQLAEGQSTWAIPWTCVHEFLAVATRPRIFDPPTSLEGACDQIRTWLDAPGLVLLRESERHWATLESLLRAGKIIGATVQDARVAALCIENDVDELWSADRDFGRFPQLKVVNPLVG